VPREIAIDSEVDLCVKGSSYFLRARLNVILPGVPRDVCATLIESAHKICPYSKAIRGNIDVLISLVELDSTTAIIQTSASAERMA
jgi:organic hydroperoxide reductase OsmC/OhrA